MIEIRDPIHGTLKMSSGEVKVLDTPAMQRLRRIKQLGFAEFSFPGATHSRYLHSLGVCHLAQRAFENIFAKYPFQSADKKRNFLQVLRLAALLHDIGHGPLSHTTEEVMPPLKDLDLLVYEKKREGASRVNRKANHEDYSIKLITDSHLTRVLQQEFSDFSPYHIALLVDKTLPEQDDFFVDGGVNFRVILSQIVSSEIDVDRMDYLERDAYFCGTIYGKVELGWLLGNLTYHRDKDSLFLGLNRRALYTFDDFLISRHHMYLMVYFHHKSIIFEEMLFRYLTSEDCEFQLPPDIEEYIAFSDFSLFENIAKSKNIWAKRIQQRNVYKVLFENHNSGRSGYTEKLSHQLEEQGVSPIVASSTARLSKYHGGHPDDSSFKIFVVDPNNPHDRPDTIERSTEIFKRYEKTRTIERVYVAPKDLSLARTVLEKTPL